MDSHMELENIIAFIDIEIIPENADGGYDRIVRNPYDECPIPEKKGYKRVHKRTLHEDWLWFYRLVPEPIFDCRTSVKMWNSREEQWEVYPYEHIPHESNANIIFEDLRDKITMFRGDPRKYYGVIRYNTDYWENRNISEPAVQIFPTLGVARVLRVRMPE